MTDAPSLDPRVNAFRSDLADVALRDLVKAERYLEPIPRQCVQGVVPMLAEPSHRAKRVSEVRYGEFVDVFDQRADGYAWIQNRKDRYVGYIYSPEVLSESIASLSYRIKALSTFLYVEPHIKAPVIDRLTLGSFVSVMGSSGPFVELASGGFVFGKHVAPTAELCEKDYVFTAGRMLGVPYLWGGRTPLGLDCSGLVQLVLDIAGYDIPRDADQQAEALSQPLPCSWKKMLWKRGDIVFFKPHHVGIMTGADHIANACELTMQVVVEPLANVVARGYEIIGKGNPCG